VTDFAGHGPVSVDDGQIKFPRATTSAALPGRTARCPKPIRNLSRCRQSGGQRFFFAASLSSRRFRMQPDCRGLGRGIVGCPASMCGRFGKRNEPLHVSSDRALVSYRGAVMPEKFKPGWTRTKLLTSPSPSAKCAASRPDYLSAPLGIATYSTTAKIKTSNCAA